MLKITFLEPGGRKEVLYSSIAFLSFMLVGCGRSFTSFLFEQLEAPNSMIHISESEVSWIASIPYLVNPVGCVISGIVMDAYGRKISVQFVFVLFILTWLVTALAKNLTVIYLGMVLQGLAGGMSFCISTYISEISSIQNRGFLLSLIEPMYASGILLSNILMCFIQWNLVSAFYTCISVTGLFCSVIICESPLWLFSKNRTENSIIALRNLRQDHLSLETEIEEMELACLHRNSTKPASKMGLVFKTWKPLVLISVLYILEQNGGFMLIISYTLKFVQSLDVPFNNYAIVITYSMCGFFASLITPFFIQKFKRKTVLTFSTVGMGMCMLIVAVYEHFFLDSKSKPVAWLVPFTLYVYVFVYTLGVLPLSFALGSEIFPQEVRGLMNGLYGSVGYLYASLTSKLFPTYLSSCGISVVLWTFCVFSFISCIFSVLFMPETKGKSLYEVQNEMKAGVFPMRKISMIKTRIRGYGSMGNGFA